MVIDYKPCAGNIVDAFASRVSHHLTGPTMTGVVAALLEPYREIEATACALLDTYTLDGAQGNQLDVLGQIIGLPRTVCKVLRILYFGLKRENDPYCCAENVGLCEGQWFVPGVSPLYSDYTFADDAEYRFFLRAKAYGISFDGTSNDVERVLWYLFDGIALDDYDTRGSTRVVSQTGGEVYIKVARNLTTKEIELSELYKYVLPYYGGYNVKFMTGTGTFQLSRPGNRPDGLCAPFAKVY